MASSVEVNGDGVQTINLTVQPIIEGEETVLWSSSPMSARSGIPRRRGIVPVADETTRAARAELQETKQRLQGTIEELETSNEELKSSNEELLSVNEELQSANEELEASKEEPSRSTRSCNCQRRAHRKVDELDRCSSDLRNMFESTRVATVFLDRDLVIRSFTRAANDSSTSSR